MTLDEISAKVDLCSSTKEAIEFLTSLELKNEQYIELLQRKGIPYAGVPRQI